MAGVDGVAYLQDNLDDLDSSAFEFGSTGTGDGPLTSIFDSAFNGPRSEMYRALLAPDLFPHERPMLIHQWSEQDREMYCGGIYTKGYK